MLIKSRETYLAVLSTEAVINVYKYIDANTRMMLSVMKSVLLLQCTKAMVLFAAYNTVVEKCRAVTFA